jgi:uncharacterized protein YcnI
MRRLIASTVVAVLALPAFAAAHVTVRPGESKKSAEEKYTVRVPTEGQVATVSVELDVPPGVTVLDVPVPEGATHEVKKTGNRVTMIKWTKEIPPRQSAEFVFVARNPVDDQITWNARQNFADGKSTPWTPATKLLTPPATNAGTETNGSSKGQASSDLGAIEAWLKGYDDAFNAKDLEKLGTYYAPQVTIYEGGGIDNGWAAYRDGHLGPELKAFENLQFGHSNRQIQMIDERAAYVISTYTLKAKMGDRSIDSGGLETLVLIRGDDGAWKIRHSHTSSRPRRPAAPGN